MPLPEWNIQGTEIVNCNCECGCPCQFSRLPTHGFCQASIFVQVDTGRFGDEPLDGLRWGVVVAWPGPIHKGNGTMQVIVDQRANDAQRAGLEAIAQGKASAPGKLAWSIYGAMTSTFLPTLSKPIDLTFDYDTRTASVRVAGILDESIGPLRNAVTGDPHRALIRLPNGFEFTDAEVASGRTKTTGDLALDFNETHAHFARVHWSTHGVIR
jgi:hypothetical protein